MQDGITEDLADQQHGHIPARVPGPSTSETNERAARARSARPASVTLSGPPLWRSRTRPSPAAPPRGTGGSGQTQVTVAFFTVSRSAGFPVR